MDKLSTEEIKGFYNSEYANKLSRQTIHKNKRLLKHLKFNKNDSVVDFGCGDGRFAHLISEHISNYTGVDFSEEFIKTAENNLKQTSINNVSFLCEDIISFCKQNPNSFDKAFALDFTEHIYDEDLINIFSAIRYSLKKDGVVYIHTPNGDYIIEKLKKWGIMKQFPEHIAIRNDYENIEIFRKSGFFQCKVEFLAHYDRILKVFHFLGYMPVLGKYFKARLFIAAKFN